jgi:hypothetical protein
VEAEAEEEEEEVVCSMELKPKVGENRHIYRITDKG